MPNSIFQENEILTGRMAATYWNVQHTREIEGFATDISVDAGMTVDFKINVNGGAGSDYLVEIFRLGYYGGDGARKVAEWVNSDATVQPDAIYEAERGLVDAGNWSVTDSWQTPENATSGVYLARLQRLDASGDPIGDAVNQVPFIVREDDRPADIVLQTSDTTWHAYNGWFGNNGQIGANLYGDASGTIDHPDIPGAGNFAQDRAYAVSYNRPLITRGIEGEQGGPAAGAQDYLFGADYAAIFWLEKNGYDVSYMSGVDTDRLGAQHLQQYQSYISVGHDEYWSGDQRGNVEAARDAGVNLLFWGGNDVYWKTRWEDSIVDGDDYRTLVSYKETWAHLNPNAQPEEYYDLDPTDIWTGTWRDDRFIGNPLAGDAADRPSLSGQPDTCNCAENALTGQLFGPDFSGQSGALDVPAEFAPLRVWRDTSIANGGALDLAPGILGYEWNVTPDDENRPAGLVKLSETTLDWDRILIDDGNTTAPGTATHNLTLYRDASGALVFGAGTVFWTWALSNTHDNEPYGGQIENTDLQQFVVNMFADMGIQPGVADTILASQGLVRASASTDVIAAQTVMDDLTEAVSALEAITVTGTSSDVSGLVALVEVSVDDGQTWQSADGLSAWTYTWTPLAAGSYQLLARAIDDSLNMPTISSIASQTIEVSAATVPDTVTLFDPFVPFDGAIFTNGAPIELGVKFQANEFGQVTELRYYREAGDADDTDTRVGHLWDSAGNLLATVTFVSDPGETGWQTALLAAPVELIVGDTYVASYATLDNYVSTSSFFSGGYTEPYDVLSAPAGSNGVFAEGSSGTFPTSSFNASNYWVDVGFEPLALGNEAPVLTSAILTDVNENSLLAAILTATDAEDDPVTFGLTGGVDQSLFSLDSVTGALSFVRGPDFEGPADANGDNIYDLTVSVSDGFRSPIERDIQIRVVDDPVEETGSFSTLFGAGDAPAAIETNDATDYELGMKFVSSESGQITSLRYFRGEADANDTDARTLNLWTGSGTLLASVAVTSGQGQSGWQVGLLDTAVATQANVTYVVSYGTVQNYAITSNGFASDVIGPDGILTGPSFGTSGGNGVFAANSTGLFPTQSFNASNYWVDVSFAVGPTLTGPSFTSSNTTFAFENQTLAAELAALDPDGDAVTFSIEGGPDGALFSIDTITGILTFATAPDFETPIDLDGDNVYSVVVGASDGLNPVTRQTLDVTVTNDPGEGLLSTLFGSSQAPDTVETADSTDYELGVRFTVATGGEVQTLSYYRGVADASDTDIRTLNLWASDGSTLGWVTVISESGQVGWQTGTLASPVVVSAGETYTASYGTTQNYALTSNFFTSEYTGADGVLTASAIGGNGVFAVGTGSLPTQSFGATNYWVDVGFLDTNAAPVFTSAATVDVEENRALVMALTTTDADGEPPVFSIEGGADTGRFALDTQSGVLSFVDIPDFEFPDDADGDNIYELVVGASDGSVTTTQTLAVSVTDQSLEPQFYSSLFGTADQPAQVSTNDPSAYELGVRFTPAVDGDILGMTYYRSAVDANDVDTRTLNLWDASGNNLASATVISDVGEAGWQLAELDSPISLLADEFYFASYGTEENYTFTSLFFNADWDNAAGDLSAPGGTNGVFSAGAVGAFPTESYNSTNFWVDVVFEPSFDFF